jgi:ParB family chromosome partitioning protein
MATVVGDDVKESKTRARRAKRQPPEPASRGLTASQLASASPPPQVTDLRRAVEQDGGWVLGTYRDPVGGHWHILAAIPIEKVEPTPFQRDLSESHVEKLERVIDRMDRFLDPIIVVRNEQGVYWTPNGHHRTAALRRIGGRSIVALLLPDHEVAYQILALNTEKAHSLREKSLEVIRMARSLAAIDTRPERDFALEFEEAAFLTLGLCYEQRGRFAGGAYQSILKRVDGFLASALTKALEARGERARKLLDLDDAVSAAVAELKARGFQSPYLRAFVVARINPLRFHKGAKPTFDDTLEKMTSRARRFDAEKVRAEQLASASGPPED